MALVYFTIFFNKDYLNLFDLLLESISKNNKFETDYLVFTHPSFEQKIQELFTKWNIQGKIITMELTTMFEACYSRLYIFDYLSKEMKVLYLDCDILVTNDLKNMFELTLEDKLYALKEGNTSDPYHGIELFKKNPNIDAFTSGIMLFNNCEIIKKLFQDILKQIKEYTLPPPICFDQSFIVYQAITQKLYNNEKLIKLVINNPSHYNKETISHFPGGVGNYNSKYDKMKAYKSKLNL